MNFGQKSTQTLKTKYRKNQTAFGKNTESAPQLRFCSSLLTWLCLSQWFLSLFDWSQT